MAKLQYKTRGGASPQGKPRVFFCCHEQDHAACFEEISNELLKLQNCAVWYLEEGTVNETLLSDLQQMQLFVMPVTTRLLTTPNAALDILFPFAEENHIPVLPLMQEQGLETLFNQKCGDRQFLNPYDRDPTAIPYGEKLEKYLSSVLVGDSLAEKVRAAFRAYVFLSYRKKDRRHARELMALIHKNDFCRDIAIWYDEYLTPGENFNDAIKAALEKSGLFVLAVTPNLVNEVNYIMTTEYPMAVEAGKRVLPVEMLATDRDSLNGSYPGLPDPTDGHDEESLTAALLQALTSLALAQQPKDPEHNFFIGLAYLSGIDVEVDHEKALRLITSAAEAGLPQAMEKLTSMYREGLGVQRSYETAIRWQEALVSHYEAAYAANPTENTALRFANSLWYLGDWLYELRKLEQALSAYTQMLTFCQAIMQAAAPFSFAKRYLSASYNKIGNILKAQGDLSGALAHYEKTLQMAKAMAEESGATQARRDLSVSYDRIGDILKARGDLAGALACYEKELQIAKELAEETNTVKSRQDLSVSYGRIGDIREAQGDLTGAQECYEKALRLRKVLAEETGTVQARRDLSGSYDNIGDIRKARGDLAGALVCYEKALQIAKVLAEKTETVEARRNLFVSYIKVGDIRYAQGDLAGAQEYYEKALQIAKALAEETGTVESCQDFSVSHEKLGDIRYAQGDLAGALKHYEKSLQIDKMLAEKTDTVASRRDLSVSYNKIGDIRKAQGDLIGALGYYEKCLRIFAALAEETGTVESRRNLSICYDNIGYVREVQGNLTGALECYEKALQLRKILAEETDTVESRRDLSVSCYNIGDICRAQGDMTGALKHYEKALQIAAALAEETGIFQARRDLSIGYNNIGNLLLAQGNIIGALESYEKALQLCQALVKETGTVQARRDLSISYENIGDILKKQGDLSGALEYYEKALQLCQALAVEIGTAESWDDLAISYYKCAAASTDASRQRELLMEAYTIWNTLAVQYPQVDKFRQRRDAVKEYLD